ncbi:MAG: hypothetical protein ACI8TP_005010 [Acidimicrobiales bacterium]
MLAAANNDPDITILHTTELSVDTTIQTGGVLNTPFVVKQANAAEMQSTFWIQTVVDKAGKESKRLQCLQVVMLDFFPRQDGKEGLIRWPHVSINTMTKVAG